MKALVLDTTEEMVLNPKYKGMQQARIEAWVNGADGPIVVGQINVWDDEELFEAVRTAIEGRYDDDSEELPFTDWPLRDL